MKRFTVTGMSCAACQARVEKAVGKVPGVSSCAVSLLTNSMGVEGTASDDAIIKAVTDAGYGAFSAEKGEKKTPETVTDALRDTETPKMKKRLLTSLGFLLALMYITMGHHMLHWPLPGFFEGNPIALGIAQLLLAAAVLLINRHFFVSGGKSLLHGAPNMDTLVALGSSASFVWSVYALFMMTDAQVKAGTAAASGWMNEFYFESAAMILVLITVGKMLEARSKGRTTDAIKSLMLLSPQTATVLRDGKEIAVPVGEVVKGDRFTVRPGESIPVDGIITEGGTAVNEAALTGESMPLDKKPGDTVSAATVNLSGFITCEAVRVGEDTALSQIIRLVSDAAATKAPIAKTADRVSGIFVPAVVAIAAVTLLVWLLLGKAFDFALARAISVLVISCPCALGLATPVAIMVGSGVGAKNGVLFKTAAALEAAGQTQIAVLDKTGTVTKGEAEIVDIVLEEGQREETLTALAAALESKSEHPLARAVVRLAAKKELVPLEITGLTEHAGSGLTAAWQKKTAAVGSLHFISESAHVSERIRVAARQAADKGQTPILVAYDGKCLGLLAAADPIKEDSAEAVRLLKKLGIETVMLSGDNPHTAKAMAEKAGISHVVAGVLPDGKAKVVAALKKLGKTAMIGDGINDAPALTAADTGIAIGAGTDVAIDAADVVLMKSSLRDAVTAIRLSRATLRNIRQNLFWAFFYNALCIPLAAGCYIGLLGWQLSPMIGAAAMSLSSFCVVSNALRLNLFRTEPGKDRVKPGKTVDKEALAAALEAARRETQASRPEITVKVEGMMCHHCEATVREVLEALPFVESAKADFETGLVHVLLRGTPDREAMRAAIEAEDYTVTGFESPAQS